MSCQDISPNSDLSKCRIPQGNTYEITIKPEDDLFVTVDYGDGRGKTISLISPSGARFDNPYNSDQITVIQDFSIQSIKYSKP
jgi:hypothetical protein